MSKITFASEWTVFGVYPRCSTQPDACLMADVPFLHAVKKVYPHSHTPDSTREEADADHGSCFIAIGVKFRTGKFKSGYSRTILDGLKLSSFNG